METQNVRSEVYKVEHDDRRDICVKRAKQRFAKEKDLPYGDVCGRTIQSIPAYGTMVFVCDERNLWD